MEKLTIQEEEVMLAIWQTGPGIIKDFIANINKPDNGLDNNTNNKPESKAESTPYTTIASIVRNLERKGYIKSKKYGNTNLYTPTIELSNYKKIYMNGIVKNYFTNSYKDMVAFFVEEKAISKQELEELLNLIKKK